MARWQAQRIIYVHHAFDSYACNEFPCAAAEMVLSTESRRCDEEGASEHTVGYRGVGKSGIVMTLGRLRHLLALPVAGGAADGLSVSGSSGPTSTSRLEAMDAEILLRLWRVRIALLPFTLPLSLFCLCVYMCMDAYMHVCAHVCASKHGWMPVSGMYDVCRQR